MSRHDCPSPAANTTRQVSARQFLCVSQPLSSHSTTPTSTPTRPTRRHLRDDRREDVGVGVLECGLYWASLTSIDDNPIVSSPVAAAAAAAGVAVSAASLVAARLRSTRTDGDTTKHSAGTTATTAYRTSSETELSFDLPVRPSPIQLDQSGARISINVTHTD